MKKITLLTLILLTAYCQLLTGTIRYVSKTGTSTPPYTSWATASDSIQKCINICQNGDTVYVANGVYKENLIINIEIALIGSSMDSTVIDGRGMGNMTITVNDNLNIENFNIYGKMNNGGDAAIGTLQQLNLLKVVNCSISETSIGIGCVNASLDVKNVYMKNLRTGFSLLSAVNPYEYNITNCIIILNNENSSGISIGFAENAIAHITNNIIIFNHPFNNPYRGIYLGFPRKVYISNNFISGFTDNIFLDGTSDTVFIKNNVLSYEKEAGTTASILNTGVKLLVNNVILSHNSIGLWTPSEWPGRVKADYNIYWQNGIDIHGITYGDSDRIADPMFIKDTIPNSQLNFDYHLQAFSPGIDRGNPSILDIDGTRSDIGMYGGPFGEIYTYQDLAPKPPRNLSAIVDTNKITLKWNRNTEADTAYYKVYRDTVENFTIDTTKLIASINNALFSHTMLPIGRYVYKVTCVDKQGNESNPSEERIVNITSINDYPMTIIDYYLYQNYPNPFNPSTTIGYKLKERGYVKLMVYDIKGELVSVLVNQEQEQGYYEVDFSVSSIQHQVSSIQNLASGIYLYRIEVIGDGTVPVYTEMGKMILLK